MLENPGRLERVAGRVALLPALSAAWWVVPSEPASTVLGRPARPQAPHPACAPSGQGPALRHPALPAPRIVTLIHRPFPSVGILRSGYARHQVITARRTNGSESESNRTGPDHGLLCGAARAPLAAAGRVHAGVVGVGALRGRARGGRGLED